jgi:hypothetical protein
MTPEHRVTEHRSPTTASPSSPGLADGTVRTPDLGGTATTRELTEAVLAAVPA